jgi:p21-activated kinase 1
MTEFPNPNKWPKTSDLCNPIHLTQVGFNSSTSELIGWPEEEHLLLQDSGISKYDQERNPLAVTEAIKFYQGDGGDVWDEIARGYIHTPDISQLSPVPGLALPSHGTVGPINVHFAAPVSVVSVLSH